MAEQGKPHNLSSAGSILEPSGSPLFQLIVAQYPPGGDGRLCLIELLLQAELVHGRLRLGTVRRLAFVVVHHFQTLVASRQMMGCASRKSFQKARPSSRSPSGDSVALCQRTF